MVYHSKSARRTGTRGTRPDQAKSARATSDWRRDGSSSGTSLSPSIFKPGFFRKSLLLFISDRKNSEWFLVHSGVIDRSPPQPAVRHMSSCNKSCKQQV